MSSEDLENTLTLLEEQFKNAYDPLQPEPDYSHLEKQIKSLQLQITILQELGITDAYIWVRQGEKLCLVHDDDCIAVSFDLYSNHIAAFIHQASEPMQVLLDNHHTLVELTIPLNTTLAEVFTKFKEITGKKIEGINGTGYQWEVAEKRYLTEHVKKYPIILKVF